MEVASAGSRKAARVGTDLFVLASVAWLVDAVAAQMLLTPLKEIYDAGAMPFTAGIWWRLAPWLALFVLMIYRVLTRVAASRWTGERYQLWAYAAFLMAAILFLFQSFRPLVIMIAPETGTGGQYQPR